MRSSLERNFSAISYSCQERLKLEVFRCLERMVALGMARENDYLQVFGGLLKDIHNFLDAYGIRCGKDVVQDYDLPIVFPERLGQGKSRGKVDLFQFSARQVFQTYVVFHYGGQYTDRLKVCIQRDVPQPIVGNGLENLRSPVLHGGSDGFQS